MQQATYTLNPPVFPSGVPDLDLIVDFAVKASEGACDVPALGYAKVFDTDEAYLVKSGLLELPCRTDPSAEPGEPSQDKYRLVKVSVSMEQSWQKAAYSQVVNETEVRLRDALTETAMGEGVQDDDLTERVDYDFAELGFGHKTQGSTRLELYCWYRK